MEFPVATWRVFRQNLPVGGGAYLRMLPYALMKNGIRSINKNENAPAVLYLHPWEIDDSQPRLEASWKSRMRQYTGLSRDEAKLERLLQDLHWPPSTTRCISHCAGRTWTVRLLTKTSE